MVLKRNIKENKSKSFGKAKNKQLIKKKENNNAIKTKLQMLPHVKQHNIRKMLNAIAKIYNITGRARNSENATYHELKKMKALIV